MAIVNFCGFESGSTKEVRGSSNATFQTTVTAGGWSIYAAKLESASSSAYVELAAIGSGGNQVIFNATEVYVRFRFRIDTLPASGNEEVCSVLSNGLNKFTLKINSSAKLELYDAAGTLIATGGTTIVTTTWYRIEVQVTNGSGGSFLVKLNGVNEISGSGEAEADTVLTAFFGRLNSGGNSYLCYIDDIQINDASFPGDTRCSIMVPNGDGFYTSGTANGAATRWQCVNEVPPDNDTTYVNAIGSDSSFTSTLGTNSSIGSTIRSAKTLCFGRADSGIASLVARLRSGSTDTDSGGLVIGTTQDLVQLLANVDPNTSGTWTQANINAAQIGTFESSFGPLRITATYLMVEYVPPAGTIPERLAFAPFKGMI